MSEIDTGGPAFPGGAASIGDGDSVPYQPGMTLRDAAALAALQGFCANPNVVSDIGYESHVVARAIAVADAFIAARRAGL